MLRTVSFFLAALISIGTVCSAPAQPVRWGRVDVSWGRIGFESVQVATEVEGRDLRIRPSALDLRLSQRDSLTRRRILRAQAELRNLPANRAIRVHTQLRIHIRKHQGARLLLRVHSGDATEVIELPYGEAVDRAIDPIIESLVGAGEPYSTVLVFEVERQKPGAVVNVTVEMLQATLGGLVPLSLLPPPVPAPPPPVLPPPLPMIWGPSGTEVRAGDWDDAVAVMAGGRWVCSGTLITKLRVVTASHCGKFGSPSFVWFGTRAGEAGRGVRAPVIDVRSYQSNPSVDAPLVLTLSFTPPEYLKPRTLARESDLSKGNDWRVVGFGESSLGTGVKMTTPISLISRDCKGSGDAKYHCRPGEIVAGGPSGDICSGDSGGPIYLLGKIPGPDKWLLAGITSRFAYGKPVCGNGSIFLRVDSYPSLHDLK